MAFFGKTVKLNDEGLPTLPTSRIQLTFDDMAIGESTYEVPWVMVVKEDGTCYIPCDSSFERSQNNNHPHGTADMKITRVQGGVIVDLSQSDHQWRPGNLAPNRDYFRVIEIINQK